MNEFTSWKVRLLRARRQLSVALVIGCVGCQLWVPNGPDEGRPNRPACEDDSDCLPDTKCLQSTVDCIEPDGYGSGDKVGRYCDTDLDNNGVPDLEDAEWRPCCNNDDAGICVEVWKP